MRSVLKVRKKAINRTAVIESETGHDYCVEIKTHGKSFNKSLENYKIITYIGIIGTYKIEYNIIVV